MPRYAKAAPALMFSCLYRSDSEPLHRQKQQHKCGKDARVAEPLCDDARLLGLGNQQRIAKLDERIAADKRAGLADMVDALEAIELRDDDGHDVLVTSGLNGLAVEADERLACLDHIAHLDKAGKTLAVHFHGAQANMDEHAKTVCRIFEEYAKPETSLRGLAKDLTARGIHGPKREAWDNVTLSRILRNPVYVRADEAVYCYYLAQGVQSRQTSADYDGEHGCVLIGKRSRSGAAQKEEKLLCLSAHEGIVSAALWLRVQEKLSFAAQLPRANAGKYSWLTGLLKCAKCGYAVKINSIKAERRCKLLCSGRSNLGGCDASIDVDLRELEAYIAGEIQRSFDACPMELLPAGKDRAQAGAILEIERKIDRLVAALAESSAVAVPYISQRIDALHAEREQLLHAPTRSAPLRRFDFQRASFDEKKLIAAEFVERIMLDGERVHIIWKA